MTWIRFPIVLIATGLFLAGTTVAAAAHDGGGSLPKKAHGGNAHSSVTAASGLNTVAPTSNVGAGSSSQATSGATSQSSGKTTNTHHGATVTRDLACGILTPPFGSVTATDSVFVLTPNGHATLVCKGDLPAGVGPEKAIVIEGLLCHAPGVTDTTESHTTITPSGEVSLTCHFVG